MAKNILENTGHGSLGNKIFNVLRDKILNEEYVKGQKLNELFQLSKDATHDPGHKCDINMDHWGQHCGSSPWLHGKHNTIDHHESGRTYPQVRRGRCRA